MLRNPSSSTFRLAAIDAREEGPLQELFFSCARFKRKRRPERDLVAWQMADALWFVGRVVNVKMKKAECQGCGQEFMGQASNPRNAPLYCSDECRCWSRHFRKKTEKNRRLSLTNYIINRWEERAVSLHALNPNHTCISN